MTDYQKRQTHYFHRFNNRIDFHNDNGPLFNLKGDIIGLSLSKSDEGNETIASGIVSRVEQTAIHVAFDETLDQQELDSDQQYKLVKLANDVTYKRLKR